MNAVESGRTIAAVVLWILPLALVLLLAAILARERIVRAIVIGLVRSVYRIRVHGLQHLPSGGALLVANHLSFVDALLVGVAIPRKVHFLMHRSYFASPIVGPFARWMGALPVASEDSPGAKAESLKQAAECASRGGLVCIFAEGGISRSGALMPFMRGLERIARDARTPIVPVGLDRVWGSIFSFAGGKVFWKRPERVPYPVDVLIGAPLPFDTDRWRVRDAVAVLIAESRERRAARTRSLAYRFLRASRSFARRPAVADSTGTRLTYGELLRAALVARAVLERELAGCERVGVLLPPCAAAVIANVGATLADVVPVNLNYTLGNTDLAALSARAGITRVITSRRFLSELDRPSPLAGAATIHMEDLRARSTRRDRLRAALFSLVPGPWLARALDPIRSGAETATIIFSSGSTGTPKGVVLSHSNVVSNVQGLAQMFSFGADDSILGVLPFFHSFGYTGTLWTPLCCGGRVVYHSNPLDASTVGELAARERPTILMGTPTFYLAYLRRCRPEQLASLRLCVSGAEKLKDSLARAWNERFAFQLHEGYGCTEMSPVVSINVPDADVGGVRQIGSKPGTVGRPLPGVAVRVVDAETRELLPPDREGLLIARGPNRMQGYLDDPERTREAIVDGWYSTGDLAVVDADGFLTITDRLSRFSKIAGEMVPHGRVEEALHDALSRLGAGAVHGAGAVPGAAAVPGANERAAVELAVTSLPDETRGERLVVLHTKLALSVDSWIQELQRSDLPRLFLPRRANFVEVGEIPRLGSGKTDLKGVREIAKTRIAESD